MLRARRPAADGNGCGPHTRASERGLFSRRRNCVAKQHAIRAVEEYIGKPLGLDSVNASRGIVKIADISMAHAVQSMTVQRGYDPRDSVMVAYGGAGPLHAVAIAHELRIKKVVIPPNCGIFSAVGMLLADAKDEYVLSHIRTFDAAAAPELNLLFASLEAENVPRMVRAGFRASVLYCIAHWRCVISDRSSRLLIDCPAQTLSGKTWRRSGTDQ